MLLASERLGPSVRALFVHAPYPGLSKFAGEPCSLLHAMTPVIERFAGEGRAGEVAVYDPDCSAEEFHRRLEEVLRLSDQLRVVGVSTSTAAIEEAQRVCATVKRIHGNDVLVIVGGPHEDDIDVKTAARLDHVDLSIAGDAEFVLVDVVSAYLEQSHSADVFCRALLSDQALEPQFGTVTLTSPWSCGPNSLVRSGRPITGDELTPRARFERPVSFGVFGDEPTHQLMISRGCSYGKCTFCAEATQGGSTVMSDVTWLNEVVDFAHPADALYFQDSIFPLHSATVQQEVLPFLHRSGRRWGCQLFLAALSPARMEALEAHGCTYVYTGLESGVQALRADVGKLVLTDDLVADRFRDLARSSMKVGISVMFGALSGAGVRETPETVEATMTFARWLIEIGVNVVGFYPNVQTLLPGTPVAAHFDVDFYRMPSFDAFDVLEDGGIGYNFATIDGLLQDDARDELVEAVARGARELRQLGRTDWPDDGV